MPLLLKDPGAALDYGVDWGSDYLSGDVLATSEWAVEPVESGGLSIAAEAHDLLRSSVSLSGGVAGHLYRLTNTVTTTAARTDRRSFTIRVEQR